MAGLSGHLRGVANCDRSVISLVRQRWVGRIRGWLEREAVSFMGHRSATRDFNDSLPPRVCRILVVVTDILRVAVYLLGF